MITGDGQLMMINRSSTRLGKLHDQTTNERIMILL